MSSSPVRAHEELRAWLEAAHRPVDSLDPDAPKDDLAPLRVIVGDAEVIGIGETVRGARSASELRRFVHRVLRVAVEDLDFRALVLEERSLDLAAVLDRYIVDGDGDPLRVLREAWAPWQTMEILEIVQWLRSWNEARPDDPVRIVGAISEDHLGLAGHILEHHDRTGDRVVYWGGAAHSAVAPAHDVTNPPKSPPGPSDGMRLRQVLGERYLSVGCICDHAVAGEALPTPPSHFAESPFALVDAPVWFLDVREPGDPAAREWVQAPAITRLIGPHYDPQRNGEFSMSGTPFGDWFDAVLYVREITPAAPLPQK